MQINCSKDSLNWHYLSNRLHKRNSYKCKTRNFSILEKCVFERNDIVVIVSFELTITVAIFALQFYQPRCLSDLHNQVATLTHSTSLPLRLTQTGCNFISFNLVATPTHTNRLQLYLIQPRCDSDSHKQVATLSHSTSLRLRLTRYNHTSLMDLSIAKEQTTNRNAEMWD